MFNREGKPTNIVETINGRQIRSDETHINLGVIDVFLDAVTEVIERNKNNQAVIERAKNATLHGQQN